MILCSATVDLVRAGVARELSTYRVEVTGKAPHDYVRIYTISARTEDLAAKEGLKRFGEDVAPLIEQGNN